MECPGKDIYNGTHSHPQKSQAFGINVWPSEKRARTLFKESTTISATPHPEHIEAAGISSDPWLTRRNAKGSSCRMGRVASLVQKYPDIMLSTCHPLRCTGFYKTQSCCIFIVSKNTVKFRHATVYIKNCEVSQHRAPIAGIGGGEGRVEEL